MRRLLPAAMLIICAACGGGGSTPTTPSNTTQANVSITAMAVTGAKTGSGFDYTVKITAQNSGTATATLGASTFSILIPGNTTGSATVAASDMFASSSLSAGASADSALVTLHDTSGKPAASSITLALAYSDSAGSKTASRSTDVPTVKSSFTLSGSVTESAPTTSTRLLNARVEIIDGPFVGKFAITDGAGNFSIPDVSGQMNVRTTLAGYEADARGFDMSQDRSASIALRPTPKTITEEFNGTISGGDSGTCSDTVFVKPCKLITIAVHNGGALSATLSWTGGSADLDLSLWNGSSAIATSLGVNSTERISSNVNAGGTYVFHVTYYGGSNIVNYNLKVTRPN
jgi:archaellum component FlaG (FlaF/FlaG flagellin family)